MNMQNRAPVMANDRASPWPKVPAIAICLDGCEPEYLTQAIAKGLMPTLKRIKETGTDRLAHSVIPSFTNPNNLSIATGRPPSVHGICGNYLYEPETGEEVMMNDVRFLRAPLVFSKFNEAGARVAIVSRVGRDPSVLPDGVNYTHVAFWVFAQITDEDGRVGTGYRIYNLYQTDADLTRSALVQDTPADFFAGAHSLDAGIIIPDARLQDKLLRVITSPTYAALHNPSYSVLANPRSSQFQNCTEHTLDVIFAALYDTADPRQIKANIAAHFKGQPIALNGVQRLLAPAASAALTTADHGSTVQTATFGSIARFMQSHDLDDEIYRITPEMVVRF